MSWRAAAYVAALTKADGITRSEKLVMLILANRHNDDTGRCDSSLDRLANETLLQKRRLQDVLESLAKKGFLNITRRPGITNQYTLAALVTTAKSAGVGSSATPAISRATPAISDKTHAVSSHGNRREEPLVEPSSSSADARTRDTDPDLGRICTAYENDIGMLTVTVSGEIIAELDAGTPPQWVLDGIAEAARYNKRSWAYVRACLRTRKQGGKDAKSGRDSGQPQPGRNGGTPRRGRGAW